MTEPTKNSILGEGLANEIRELVRQVVREELGEIGNGKATTSGLMSPKQAGEFYSVPKSWILESARSGQLPSVKMGHYRRFRREDLDDYIEKHRREKRA